MKFDIVSDVPDWATCYLYYDDASGLSEEDIKLCDEFVEKLRKQGCILVCPKDDGDGGFTWHPAFGLACNVMDWVVQLTEDSDDSSDAVQN